MVTIPTPQQPGQPIGSVQTVDAQTPFQNIRPASTAGVGAAAEQTAGLLGAVGDVGMQLAGALSKRRNDIAMRQIETQAMQFERDLLNPTSGVLSRRQGNAVGITNEAGSQLDQFRDRMLSEYGEGLSSSGRQAIEQYLDGFSQRAWKTAAAHELRETKQYEETMFDAQMEALGDRATIFAGDPDAVGSIVNRTIQIAEDHAASLGITDPAARDQFVQDKTTSTLVASANALASTDPERASQLLDEGVKLGVMDPTDAQRAQQQLKPLVIKQKARQAVDLARAADTSQDGVISADPGQYRVNPVMNPLIGTREGASRMLRPDAVQNLDEVLAGPFSVLQSMVPFELQINDALAKEGTSRERNTPGSQHFHGKALDINMKGLSPAQRMDVVNKALAAGFTGFGFGRNILHLDTGPRRSWTYGNDTFGGVSAADLDRKVRGYDAPPVNPQRFRSGSEVIANIEDPEVRAEAEKQYNAAVNAEYTRTQREGALVANDIITQVSEAHANGLPNPVDDLLSQPGVRAALGSRVDTVESYAAKRYSGEDIKTDPDAYSALTNMMYSNPAEFAKVDLTADYAHALSPGNLRQMIDAQAKIRGDAQNPDRTPVSMSNIRSNVLPTIETFQVDEDSADFVTNTVVNQVAQFITSEVDRTGRAPNMLQQQSYAKTIMTQLTTTEVPLFDPAGLNNAETRENLATVMQAASTMSIDDLLDTDIQMTYPNPQGGSVTVQIRRARVEEFIRQFSRTQMRTPTPGEIIYALQLSPPPELRGDAP